MAKGGIKNYVSRRAIKAYCMLRGAKQNPKLAKDYALLRFHVFLSRLGNKLNFYHEPKLKSIVSAKIELTQACPSKCITCNFWRINSMMNGCEKKETKLKHDEFEELLRQLKKMNCNAVQLLGGETLAYRRAPELIKLASSLGMKTNIITNGILMTPEIAKEIGESGLTTLGFSIDGPKDVNNYIRGHKDAFDKQINAIKLIQKYDPENKIHKSICVTISVPNVEYLDKIMDIANEVGIKEVSYYMMSTYSEDTKEQADDLFKEKVGSLEFMVPSSLAAKDKPLLDKKRKEILRKAKEYGITVRGQFFTKEMVDVDKAIRREDKFCITPYKFCTIDCYGHVYPCDLLRYSFGNIRENSLKEILNSARYSKFSKMYIKKFKDIKICRYCPLYGPI